MRARPCRRNLYAALASAVLLGLSLLSVPASAQRTQAELDSEFEEMMNGAHLQGHFTINGMDIPIQPESYSLSKVEKQEDGKWLFVAAMKYMNTEVSLPMPFEVIWSGDTPVITVTDEPIEGLEGVFSARVLIYDGMYAGTWKHNTFGGQMYGKIVKAGESETATDSDSQD